MTNTSTIFMSGIFLIYQPPFVFMVEIINRKLYAKFFNPQAFGLIGRLAVLTVHDSHLVIVDQVIMAVHAFFLVALAGVHGGTVGQHRATVIRDIQHVAVALHALSIIGIGIRFGAIFGAVIFIHRKVDD
jgi:hypothetical protein